MTNDNRDNHDNEKKFLKIFGNLFVDRTPDVVSLHRQFERRNLRSHEKKFTGPRGSGKRGEIKGRGARGKRTFSSTESNAGY